MIIYQLIVFTKLLRRQSLENNKRRNKTKKLNIAVIGSGATALGVIKTLLEKKKI